jgi:Mg-chelatase subunit ChlD
MKHCKALYILEIMIRRRGKMKKYRLLSLISAFLLCVTQVQPVNAAVNNTNDDVVAVNRTIDGNEFKFGDKIAVNYTITPKILSYKEDTSKNKDIVIVIDTSGSMKEKINHDNGKGHGWGFDGSKNPNDSKLDIMKRVASDFVDKFDGDVNVNIDLLEYADIAMVELTDSNISYICNELKIDHWDIQKDCYHDNYYVTVNGQNKIVKTIEDLLNIYYPNNRSYAIKNVIQGMQAGGSTNTGDALRRAYYMLNNANGHNKYIVLMTDGEAEAYSVADSKGDYQMDEGAPYDNYCTTWSGNKAEPDYRAKSLEYATKVASEKISKSGIKTFIIGFGDGTDDNANIDSDMYVKNKQIADAAKGVYFNALDEDEISNIYDKIGDYIEADKSARVYFHETVPAGLSVDSTSLPQGLSVSGNAISGYLSDIHYTVQEDENGEITGYSADPVNIKILFTANSNDNSSDIECTFDGSPSSYIKYTVDGNDTVKYFQPSTISIKNALDNTLMKVERNIDDTSFEVNKPFDVHYRIIPQRIRASTIQNTVMPKDVVLVFDTSGSMTWNLEGKDKGNPSLRRIGIMKNTAYNFLNNIKDTDKMNVGLVDYATKIKSSTDLQSYSSYNVLADYIQSMSADGATNIGEGLRKAYYMLKSQNDDNDKYIILMSDGFPTAWSSRDTEDDYLLDDIWHDYKIYYYTGDNDPYGYAADYANEMAKKISSDSNTNIKTFVVGFGNGINSDKLHQIADNAKGDYFEAKDADAMNTIYSSIQDIVKANINASLHFEEGITGNMQVINQENLPYGIKFENGKLSGDINNIYYKLSDDGSYYEADPIVFTVTYKPLSGQNCILGADKSSFVNYKYSNGAAGTTYFDERTINLAQTIIKHGIFTDNKIQSGKSFNIVQGFKSDFGVEFSTGDNNPEIRLNISDKLSKIQFALYRANSDGTKIGSPITSGISLQNVVSGRLDNLSSNNSADLSKLGGNLTIKINLPKEELTSGHYILIYSIVPDDIGPLTNKIVINSCDSTCQVNVVKQPKLY